MRISRTLSYAGAVFFILYGILFAVFPNELSMLVVDAVPTSTSAVIDIRATYGGMSVAIGTLLIILAKNDATLRLALTGLLLLMVGMAVFRILGLILDGGANAIMFIYLGLEVIVSVSCVLCLKLDKRGGI